jgi:hypothetical protein
LSQAEPYNIRVFKKCSEYMELKKVDIGELGRLRPGSREKWVDTEGKLEKLVFTLTEVPGVLISSTMGYANTDKYDFPALSYDFVVGEKHIMPLVDLIPMRPNDEDYKKKYIEPMKPVFEKWKNLPGFDTKRLSWWDTFRSPYDYLARTPPENKQKTIELLLDYVELWCKFVKEAKPVEDKEKLKKAQERKKYIRETMIKFDPGKGPFTRLFGPKVAHQMVELLF